MSDKLKELANQIKGEPASLKSNQHQHLDEEVMDGEIFIAMPSEGIISIELMNSYIRLIKPKHYFHSTNMIPLDKARNALVADFLVKAPNATHILFWDDDCIPEPDALMRLWLHNEPIVSGLYFQKGPPYHPLMSLKVKNLDNQEGYTHLIQWKDGQPYYVDGIGMGFVLIRRDVFQEIEFPPFEFTEFSEDYSFCVPPGTLILGDTLSPIEMLKIGDRVLTHRGNLSTVTDVMSRPYNGYLIGIEPYYDNTVWLTGNHPVLVQSIESANVHLKNKWKIAKYINRSDRVFIPKYVDNRRHLSSIYLPHYISTNQLSRSNNEWYYNRARHNHIPNRIDLTDSVLETMGYYIAEGYSTQHQVYFCFGSSEHNMIDHTKNTMEDIGIDVHVSEDDSATKVYINSKIMARLFTNLFGKGASLKRLPRFINSLSSDQIGYILTGYFKGDGHYQSAVTTSPLLSRQLKYVLLRTGILPSIKSYDNYRYVIQIPSQMQDRFNALTGISGRLKGKTSMIREVDHLRIGDSLSTQGGFWIPIRSIHRQRYLGPVYNISVDGAESYVAESITVHNCSKVRESGFKIKVDTNVKLKHLAMNYPVTYEDFKRHQDQLIMKQVKFGDPP